MDFQKAAVIGAGAMGCGITQVLSQAGLNVCLIDISEDLLQKGLNNIKRMYESRVQKEVLSQSEAERYFALIKTSTRYEDLNDVDLVIEAALEKMEVKIGVFAKLDKFCPEKTILASNTSSLSISEIAQATKRPEKVLGMHFFNPAQAMKLIEVIPGIRTSEETLANILVLSKKLGKIPVKVTECPGFLVNRLLFPYLNEAIQVVQEGKISPAEIDQACLDFGLPMGPLTLLDMTGLDVCLSVNQFLHDQYGIRFENTILLDKLVKSGFLGQKTNMGIYTHAPKIERNKTDKKEINPRLNEVLSEISNKNSLSQSNHNSENSFDVYRLILPMFNESMYVLQEEITTREDIDLAMLYGAGLKRGLLTIANEKGFAWCHAKLQQYQNELGERFRPSWYLSKLVKAGLHDFNDLSPVPTGVK